MALPSAGRRLEAGASNQKGAMLALASESLEVAAPVEGPTRVRREPLRLVSRLRPRLIGRSLPEELLEIWGRALIAADVALFAAAAMKAFTPDELSGARHRLTEERRWLMGEMASSMAE
jgi:hypothetical protein